jgi:hypothetical protein
MAIAGISANKQELLQIADAVAREKTIDRKIVIQAMRSKRPPNRAMARKTTSAARSTQKPAKPGCRG